MSKSKSKKGRKRRKKIKIPGKSTSATQERRKNSHSSYLFGSEYITQGEYAYFRFTRSAGGM